LHVEESLQSIDFNDFEPFALKAEKGDQLLADCSEFRIQKYARGSGDEEMVFAEREQARLVSVVSGEVAIWDMAGNESIACKGDTVILPYGEMFRMTFEKNVVFLITDKFA
jgi:mannose-6-phosphate isomerase